MVQLCASYFLEWLTLGFVIIMYLSYYFKNVYSYWKKRGIKYAKLLPLFGNSKDIVLKKKTIGEVFREIYEEFPDDPYVGIYELIQPVLLIRDPKLIKHILVKDFHYFQDRGMKINDKLDPLEVHLGNMEYARWRILRSLFSPLFSPGKIKLLFPLMKECSLQFKELLDKPARNCDLIHINESVARYTIEIIGLCIFGFQCSAFESNESEFIKFSKQVFGHSKSFTFKLVLKSAWPFMSNLLKVKLYPVEITDFFMNTVRNTIKYREENNYVRNDFMQLLMQLKNKGMIQLDENTAHEEEKNNLFDDEVHALKKKMELELTDNLLAAQAFLFFVAGFDSSAATLTFCLYELALNSNIQTKLRNSILSYINEYDGYITYDGLQQNQYLDNVIKETLRKYPPIHTLSRCLTKPYLIPGSSTKLDRGQKIQIPVYGIHHDPKYYPDPECFNPENFSPEAVASRPPYTYFPFGDGPRQCIGVRFALLLIKLAVAELLTNFEFNICKKNYFTFEIRP